jgi:hypothetical protein
MKIFDSPASTIFATNSEGVRYAIAISSQVSIAPRVDDEYFGPFSDERDLGKRDRSVS